MMNLEKPEKGILEALSTGRLVLYLELLLLPSQLRTSCFKLLLLLSYRQDQSKERKPCKERVRTCKCITKLRLVGVIIMWEDNTYEIPETDNGKGAYPRQYLKRPLRLISRS